MGPTLVPPLLTTSDRVLRRNILIVQPYLKGRLQLFAQFWEVGFYPVLKAYRLWSSDPT